MDGKAIGRTLAFSLMGAVVGLVLILLPVLDRIHAVTPFAIAEVAIKRLSFFALFLLGGAGVVWGLLLRRLDACVTSFCQSASLPIIAVFQMFHDPTSHNLWPLEFMIYGFMGAVGVLGAALGYAVKGWIGKAEAPRL